MPPKKSTAARTRSSNKSLSPTRSSPAVDDGGVSRASRASRSSNRLEEIAPVVVDLDEVEGNGGAGSQSNGGKKKKKKKKKNESEEGRSTATSPATSPSKRMDVGKASEVARDSSPSSEGREGGAGEAAYYSYESDSFDPALVDEEEVPTEELPDDGATTDTSKGKARASQFFDGGGSGYNSLKSFEGQLYSGMAIGASNTWQYQPGVWKETKKEPDLWEVDYQTNKVRNHKAPSGSGAPVGTEYHWYIVAHQYVKKIDANTYETHLQGHKYKLTHKNVNQKNWAIPTVKGQRDREVFLLQDAIRRVEGLPPVLSTEKVKVDKKEKGQSTLGSFFTSSPQGQKKRKADEADLKHENDAAAAEDVKQKRIK